MDSTWAWIILTIVFIALVVGYIYNRGAANRRTNEAWANVRNEMKRGNAAANERKMRVAARSAARYSSPEHIAYRNQFRR